MLQESCNFQTKVKMSLDRLCPYNNALTFLCSNPECQKVHALLCNIQNCNCLKKEHPKCSYVYAETLITKINKKRASISPEFQKTLDNLKESMNELIEKLSNDRDSLDIFVQNFGLNQAENKLIEFLQTGNMHKVTGRLVAVVNSKISEFKQQKKKDAQKTLTKFNLLKSDIQSNMAESMSWFQKYNGSIQDILNKQPDPYATKAERIIKAVSGRRQWKPLVDWIGNNCPLNELKELNMSGNPQTHDINFYRFLRPVTIRQIASCFSCLRNLIVLDLSGNRIKSIQNLKKLNALQILNLSNNYICRIKNLEKGLNNLKALSLHQNRIQKIQNIRRPQSAWQSLKLVTIFDNPAITYNPTTQHISYNGEQQIKKLREESVKVIAIKKQFVGFNIKAYIETQQTGLHENLSEVFA